MKLPAAGWGVLNFTSAGLRDWSLTDSLAACAQLTHPQVHRLHGAEACVLSEHLIEPVCMHCVGFGLKVLILF